MKRQRADTSADASLLSTADAALDVLMNNDCVKNLGLGIAEMENGDQSGRCGARLYAKTPCLAVELLLPSRPHLQRINLNS